MQHLRNMRSTGPSRAPVHRHRARTTHADPAGEAIGKCRVEIALHIGDDVENRLVRSTGHRELLESADLAPSPDRYGYFGLLAIRRHRFVPPGSSHILE